MKPVLFSIEGLDHSGKLTDLELILNTKDEFLYLIEKKRNSISAYSISDSSNSNRLFRVTQLTELALNPAQADFQSNIFTFNNLISFAPPNQLNVISTLSRMITNRFKMYIYEDTIDSLLNEVLTPNEKPTAYIYGTLSDGELYLCIGTSQGNLIFIKLFIYESEDINFFICRQLTSEVVFMNLFSQTLICSSQSDELVLIRFSQEVPHVELKKVGVRRDRVVVLKEISSTVVKKISTTSKIERILSVVFLGEEEEQDDLIFEFCSNIVGLILENNQLTLLDLSSSTGTASTNRWGST